MKRILVCGDAMIDRYLYGTAERMSPEAPVPVFKVEREESRDGAAANVTENIRAMGAEVAGIYSSSWDMDETSIFKTRMIINGTQVFARIDEDYKQEPLEVAFVARRAEEYDIVVLCDYGKGTLDNIGEIIGTLKAAGKTVIVDPKARRAREYKGADWIKPNLAEMQLLIGRWSSEDELEFKVKALQRAAGIPHVLLTRGAQGMTLFAGARIDIPPINAGPVLDVCGAGDTAIAGLAVGLARGYTAGNAARVANIAAGIAVTRFGTSIVTKEEVFGDG
jgi:rfaE bifunctional protein kinase chain/domain